MCVCVCVCVCVCARARVRVLGEEGLGGVKQQNSIQIRDTDLNLTEKTLRRFYPNLFNDFAVNIDKQTSHPNYYPEIFNPKNLFIEVKFSPNLCILNIHVYILLARKFLGKKKWENGELRKKDEETKTWPHRYCLILLLARRTNVKNNAYALYERIYIHRQVIKLILYCNTISKYAVFRQTSTGKLNLLRSLLKLIICRLQLHVQSHKEKTTLLLNTCLKPMYSWKTLFWWLHCWIWTLSTMLGTCAL